MARTKASREYEEDFAAVTKVAGDLGIDLGRYRVDRSQWVLFNQLRDQGRDFEHISRHTAIHDLAAHYLLEGLRKCVLKWGSDEAKVSECIQGKIDP